MKRRYNILLGSLTCKLFSIMVGRKTSPPGKLSQDAPVRHWPIAGPTSETSARRSANAGLDRRASRENNGEEQRILSDI